MSKFKDMYGATAEVRTVSFKDYGRIKRDSSTSTIYRVGSGSCTFWVWAGVCYANRREAYLNFASREETLQAWIENKIRGY